MILTQLRQAIKHINLDTKIFIWTNSATCYSFKDLTNYITISDRETSSDFLKVFIDNINYHLVQTQIQVYEFTCMLYDVSKFEDIYPKCFLGV